MDINTEVMGDGTRTSVVSAPFDKGLEYLKAKGEELISAEENVRLRIQQGYNSPISQLGNYVREGVLYVPKKGIFLTKKSPIMQNLQEAMNAHRNEGYFYLTERQVESALDDSVEISKNRDFLGNLRVPTNRFGENEITRYFFGNVAEEYGEFLFENGIDQMPIYLDDLKDEPFARQLWFRNLGDRSGLDCDDSFLHYYYNRLRGVKNVAEDTPQKNSRYSRNVRIPSEPLRKLNLKVRVADLPPVPDFEEMDDEKFGSFLRYIGGDKR